MPPAGIEPALTVEDAESWKQTSPSKRRWLGTGLGVTAEPASPVRFTAG